MNPTWTDLLPAWSLALWANDQIRIASALIGAAIVAYIVIPGGKHRGHTERGIHDPDVGDLSRKTNTFILRRLLWRFRPPSDSMRVDGLIIDRSRKPHCAWLAPTGGGKSASVATIRVDGARPTLAVTPDLSDPLVDATALLGIGGFRWTACVSTRPVNFLIGTPTEVAERLTEVFRSGGVGAWKRAARRITADVIRDIDAADEPRTLRLIGERLEQAVKSDRELRTVCAGWVARFLDLADQFGPSIGPDGVDLADLLRQGVTVLLDNDSFDHASLGGDVVALGLAEAKRCASLVPGGFRLIFEEAGQLGERIDLAEPFFRAGRRRKIPVDVLTQAESDLNEGISANIGTRIYFAQELKSLQRIAADRLALEYTSLDPANMKDFSAWVSHGNIRRLVRFPKPPRSSLSTTASPPVHEKGSPRGETRRYVIEELAQPTPIYPALPAPPLLLQELLSRSIVVDGCRRWLGMHDKAGYGYVSLDGRKQLIHRVAWALVYGPIPIEDGESLTLDHRRTCHKDCFELSHLDLCTRAENSKRRWRVRGVAAD